MKVRRLKPADVKEVSVLMRSTIRGLKRHYTADEIREEVDAYSVKNMRARLRLGSRAFLVAEDNGMIVGVVAYHLTKVPGLCWINWIVVKAGHRREGVSGKLINGLEAVGRGKWTRIQGGSRVSNKPSVAMFKSLGFRKIARRRRRIRKRNSYTWEKAVRGA